MKTQAKDLNKLCPEGKHGGGRWSREQLSAAGYERNVRQRTARYIAHRQDG